MTSDPICLDENIEFEVLDKEILIVKDRSIANPCDQVRFTHCFKDGEIVMEQTDGKLVFSDGSIQTVISEVLPYFECWRRIDLELDVNNNVIFVGADDMRLEYRADLNIGKLKIRIGSDNKLHLSSDHPGGIVRV